MELPCALLYRTDAAMGRIVRRLVWGWGTIGVFLGFATRVHGCVVGVGRVFVFDFRRRERLLEAFFGCCLGVGLCVADGKSRLIFLQRFFAVVFNVVEPAKIDVRPGESA